MPKIEIDKLADKLSPEELELVRGIISTRGKNKGCLRASKPDITYHQVTRYCEIFKRVRTITEPDPIQGKTAYIWRQVAFVASPIPQHQCLPMTADFDLPGSWGDDKKAMIDDLDRIVDIVIGTIDTAQWHGIRRWAQAGIF